jgi:hypothetical protein
MVPSETGHLKVFQYKSLKNWVSDVLEFFETPEMIQNCIKINLQFWNLCWVNTYITLSFTNIFQDAAFSQLKYVKINLVKQENAVKSNRFYRITI